jgi:ankyrin repeat protein
MANYCCFNRCKKSVSLFKAIDIDDADELSKLFERDLKQQQRINKIHKNGETFLTRASLDGCVKCVQVLINRKCDVNAPVGYIKNLK